jgi:very-short-patch-repair endonuclease
MEVDGAPFHSSPEQKQRDAFKDRLLGEKGWKVYRMKDDGLTFKELEEETEKFAKWLASGS